MFKHKLGNYFLKEYLREHHQSDCLDFVNEVDKYRRIVQPTPSDLRVVLASLRRIALIEQDENENDQLRNIQQQSSHDQRHPSPRRCRYGLPVDHVLACVALGKLHAGLFDECYDRVMGVLRSFYPSFLKSDSFLRFVRCMSYCRTIKQSDLRVLKCLGFGAFGRVLAVEKRDTRQLFAMKEISKVSLRSNRFSWMCKNEMEVLAMTNSPFVLNLKYAFHDKTAVHFLFELCTGGDLLAHLQRAPFSLGQVRRCTTEIALGLNHIHSLGWCYRDLKPSNIMLTESGHCKITDLGMCLRLPKNGVVQKHVGGTPGYWSPEVLAGVGNFAASDYWSLGVLVYNMITSRNFPDPLSEKRPSRRREREAYKAFKPWSPFTKTTEDKQRALKDPTMKYIDATVNLPEDITGPVRDLIEQLLVVDPVKRLGGEGGFERFQRHPFFRRVDWKKVERQESKPIFIPQKVVFKRRLLFPPKIETRGKRMDFSPIRDTSAEKRTYDKFMFTNEDAFYDEVVESIQHGKGNKLKLDGDDGPCVIC